MYDKTSWLAERDIEAPWPVAGLPEVLHADNGPDFRSRAFVRACRNHGVQVVWRPVGQPHFGGHIERLIGTQMGAVHLLPGTTFSNPVEREGYQSSHAARMTLRELERWIGWEVAGHYHQRVHAGLHRPPIAVWREHEDRRNFRLPVDRLSLGFLSARGRALPPAGRDPFLQHQLPVHDPRGGCRPIEGEAAHQIDPRDLSRIFVRRSSGRFVEARYRNLSWPAITMAEQKAAVRRLKAQGRREIDETMIFTTTLVSARSRTLRRDKRRLLAGGGNSDLHLRPPTRRAEASKGSTLRKASGAEEGAETWSNHDD